MNAPLSAEFQILRYSTIIMFHFRYASPVYSGKHLKQFRDLSLGLCLSVQFNALITPVTYTSPCPSYNMQTCRLAYRSARLASIAVCVVLDYNEQSSQTSVIQQHYVFLLETLDVKLSGLVHKLYAENVVSALERDDIIAEKTSFIANEKFLSVLSRKSTQQFQLFLDALDNCGQQHVRNVITEDRQG